MEAFEHECPDCGTRYSITSDNADVAESICPFCGCDLSDAEYGDVDDD